MHFIWERVSLQRIHIVGDIDKRVYSRILNTFEVFLDPMNLPSTDLKIASHLGFLKVTIDNKSKPQTAETRHLFKRTDGKTTFFFIISNFFFIIIRKNIVATYFDRIIVIKIIYYMFVNFHIICSQIGYHYVPFLNAVNRLHV
jgi:hypothetical protein